MRRPPRERYPITCPNDGMCVMLLVCLEQARREGEEKYFMNAWVNPPLLSYAWELLRTYDIRYKDGEHQSDYHIVPHGAEKRYRK